MPPAGTPPPAVHGMRNWLREGGIGASIGLVVAAQTLTHATIAFAPLGLDATEKAFAIALGASAPRRRRVSAWRCCPARGR